ncbi:MAG: 1-acyl-sn-glycerol-3-phosphate acyltransferase [Clostridia bacterium]|nr:1-acyl-sn-glycerol-3-phosphate acyltransferase [Clostridia bacterium]
MFIRFLASIFKYPVRLFFPCKVIGNHKREKKACLYFGNHVAGFDSVLFYLWTHGEMPCYLYKAELSKIWPLNWICKWFRAIPVNRGDADITSVKITLQRLKEGRNVFVAPEGHRNPAFNCLLPFRKGAALYALKSKAPIRLFYIWERNRMFRKNYIIMGDEFTLDEYYDKPITKALLQEVTDLLQAKVDELRVKLNQILAQKGIKHRRYTKKEIANIRREYGDRADEVIANTYVVEAPMQVDVLVEQPCQVDVAVDDASQQN